MTRGDLDIRIGTETTMQMDSISSGHGDGDEFELSGDWMEMGGNE